MDYYFLNIEFVNQLTKLMMSAPQKAGQKPDTEKPSIKVDTNQNKKALITNVNKPSVIIFIGKVNKTNNGLITALIKPKITAVIKAA
jgi:hypothetical protein